METRSAPERSAGDVSLRCPRRAEFYREPVILRRAGLRRRGLQFEMPDDMRAEVLERLANMNVTGATLFPDLAGLARFAADAAHSRFQRRRCESAVGKRGDDLNTAIYARKSTEQAGVADEQKSVRESDRTRAPVRRAERLDGRRRFRVRRRRDLGQRACVNPEGLEQRLRAKLADWRGPVASQHRGRARGTSHATHWAVALHTDCGRTAPRLCLRGANRARSVVGWSR